MEKIIKVDIPDDKNAIFVPFDMGKAGKFNISIHPEQENGDKVVLVLDREACKSFSKIFAQLAHGDYHDFHVHLGYNETSETKHGFRIELKDGDKP
jgi:hypothetical protein